MSNLSSKKLCYRGNSSSSVTTFKATRAVYSWCTSTTQEKQHSCRKWFDDIKAKLLPTQIWVSKWSREFSHNQIEVSVVCYIRIFFCQSIPMVLCGFLCFTDAFTYASYQINSVKLKTIRHIVIWEIVIFVTHIGIQNLSGF